MKYKIGDEVKIIASPIGCWDGKICIVIEILSTLAQYPIRVKDILNTNWERPMMEKEIELTKKIGEQLLLFEL